MKRLPLSLTALAAVAILGSCNLDKDREPSSSTEIWREKNAEWYLQQLERKNPDGTPYFEKINPAWSPSSEVLMHWHNDRSLTAGNLVPLETSTVDTKYILHLYDGTAVDSSYTLTASYGDSLFRTKVTGVIPGWQIALQSMHVGDSVTLILPYTEGYGIATTGKILPYSTLQFDLKLVDIPFYELRPH